MTIWQFVATIIGVVIACLLGAVIDIALERRRKWGPQPKGKDLDYVADVFAGIERSPGESDRKFYKRYREAIAFRPPTAPKPPR